MYVFTYTVCIYKTTEGRLRLSQTKTAAEDAGVGVATEALSPELDHFFVVVVPLKAFLAGHVSFFFFFFLLTAGFAFAHSSPSCTDRWASSVRRARRKDGSANLLPRWKSFLRALYQTDIFR